MLDIKRRPLLPDVSVGNFRRQIVLASWESLFSSSICLQVFSKDIREENTRRIKVLIYKALAVNCLRWSMGRDSKALILLLTPSVAANLGLICRFLMTAPIGLLTYSHTQNAALTAYQPVFDRIFHSLKSLPQLVVLPEDPAPDCTTFRFLETHRLLIHNTMTILGGVKRCRFERNNNAKFRFPKRRSWEIFT